MSPISPMPLVDSFCSIQGQLQGYAPSDGTSTCVSWVKCRADITTLGFECKTIIHHLAL